MQMSSPPDDQKNDALVEKNSIDTIAQFSLTVFPDFCPSWPTKTLTICLLYARWLSKMRICSFYFIRDRQFVEISEKKWRAVFLCSSFFHRKRNRYRKRNRPKLSSMEREEKVPRRFWEREKNPKSIGITFFFPSSLLQTDTQIVRQYDLGLAQQIISHW